MTEQFPKEMSDKRRKNVNKMNAARENGKKAWIAYDICRLTREKRLSQEFVIYG